MMKTGLMATTVSLAVLAVGVLAGAPAMAQPAPTLSAAEMDQAKQIYFERCAGCHAAGKIRDIGRIVPLAFFDDNWVAHK